MYKTLIVMIVPFLFVVGCNNQDSNQSEQSEQSYSIENVNATVQDSEVIATNLKVPWDIIQTAETFFISQRGGTIIKVDENGEKTEMPLQMERDVVHRGEGGLLGFVLHPNYSQNRAYDEINLIKPGANYGWPVIRGDEQKEGMERPLFHSGENTWAPSGLTYRNGHLYMAGLRGEQIREFDLEQKSSRVFVDGVGRVRDILFDENDMYFITNNTDGRGTPRPNDDKLIKVVLKQES